MMDRYAVARSALGMCGVHQSLEHVARALPASVAVEAKVARMAVLDLLQAVRERG